MEGHGFNDKFPIGDPAWDALVNAGKVEDASESTFTATRAAYLDRLSKLTQSKSSIGRRALVFGTAAAGVALAAILIPALSRGTGSTFEAGSRQLTPKATFSTPSPTQLPPGSQVTTIDTGNQAGSLVAYFAAPTFDEFTRTSYVHDVVEGTVLEAQSRFIQGIDDGSIVTELTILVTRGRQAKAGNTITAFESGGIVPKKDYQTDLTSKFGQLDPSELEGFVQELFNGRAPDEAGDRVLVAIGGSSTTPGPPVVAGLHMSEPDGGYSWVGSPPNEKWDRELNATQVDDLFK